MNTNSIPTEQQMSELPVGALMAISSRYARKSLPFFEYASEYLAEFSEDMLRDKETLTGIISRTENFICSASDATSAGEILDDYRVTEQAKIAIQAISDAAYIVLTCSTTQDRNAVNVAAHSVLNCANNLGIESFQINHDFELLMQKARELKWTDNTRVYQDQFGE